MTAHGTRLKQSNETFSLLMLCTLCCKRLHAEKLTLTIITQKNGKENRQGGITSSIKGLSAVDLDGKRL
jgi:hypothetical protein